MEQNLLSQSFMSLMTLYWNKNLQNTCKIMVQREEPEKKSVLPQLESNVDLHLLRLVPPSVPPTVSHCMKREFLQVVLKLSPTILLGPQVQP